MCWSGEASTVLATIGLATTAYAAHKKEPAALWICLGYFSLMEALQAYTYMVIDSCGNPNNQLATLLGYLHIAFQPFFINAISMYFIPQNAARKIAPYAYAICFASTILMLIHLYPLPALGQCEIGRPLCAHFRFNGLFFVRHDTSPPPLRCPSNVRNPRSCSWRLRCHWR